MEYYSVMKRKKTFPFVAAWMDLVHMAVGRVSAERGSPASQESDLSSRRESHGTRSNSFVEELRSQIFQACRATPTCPLGPMSCSHV